VVSRFHWQVILIVAAQVLTSSFALHAQNPVILRSGEREFQIADVDRGTENEISFKVMPSLDRPKRAFGVAILGVPVGSGATLENLAVLINGKASFLVGHQSNNIYWSWLLRAPDHRDGVPLIVQDLGDSHITGDTIRLRLEYQLPGFPPGRFPTNGGIQVGLTRKGTKAEPWDVLISNTVEINLTPK
jgi:hypothetical protein